VKGSDAPHGEPSSSYVVDILLGWALAAIVLIAFNRVESRSARRSPHRDAHSAASATVMDIDDHLSESVDAPSSLEVLS